MNKPLIVIIDYGMGNIQSIINKINSIGFEAVTTCDIGIIKKADKIILPGVGHFSVGMKRLDERNLIEVLNLKVIKEGIPILGICLGMQLFTGFSEEGEAKGLNWIDAVTSRFKLNDIKHKVPHIGWNSIIAHKGSPLLGKSDPQDHYYFVHSYHVICKNEADILTSTFYGYEFTSSIQHKNIFGTQFHPEKSHECGERLLSNFLNL